MAQSSSWCGCVVVASGVRPFTHKHTKTQKHKPNPQHHHRTSSVPSNYSKRRRVRSSCWRRRKGWQRRTSTNRTEDDIMMMMVMRMMTLAQSTCFWLSHELFERTRSTRHTTHSLQAYLFCPQCVCACVSVLLLERDSVFFSMCI